MSSSYPSGAPTSSLSASLPGALIFLKNGCASLAEELNKRLDAERRATAIGAGFGGGSGAVAADGAAREPLAAADIRITDFDATFFRLEVVPGGAAGGGDLVRVSMTLPCWADLLSSGVEARLRSVYGALLSASPHEGADVTLCVDACAPLAAGGFASVAALVSAVACLRLHALGAPFDAALASVAARAPGPGAVLTLRPREPVFILPRPDRVAVIYALHCADATDRALARVVCQEFVEAQRHISGAPPVNFSDGEPPLELRGHARADLLRHAEESFVGYLTLSMLPRHFDSDAKRANAVALLAQFRTYLDYHIKAAKSSLHARMRARVDAWMLVLNRAVADDPFASKEKKLSSGKTFVKK